MNQFNQRQPDCWFSHLLDKKGEDYISNDKILDTEITRNADRIIDDIINGRIDYNRFGYCLLQQRVFSNLYSYCTNKVTTLSADLFALRYTLSQCDIGNIKIMNSSHIPENREHTDPFSVPFPYNIDSQIWNQGVSTVSSNMYYTIATEIRDKNIEYNKYLLVSQALGDIYTTKNVFSLQWLTNGLKQYIRTNNKYNM